MKSLLFRLLIVVGYCFCADLAGAGVEHDRALFQAMKHSSIPDIDASIASGANINGRVPDSEPETTMLMAAVRLSGDGTDLVVHLLRAGANPKLGTRDGRSPILYAHRMGKSKLVSLFVNLGIALPDETSLLTRAINTKIDASLMAGVVDHFLIDTGEIPGKRVTFLQLKEYCEIAPWPIVRNRGVDPFGNEFLFNDSYFRVSISKATVEAASSAVPISFWAPFPIVEK